MIKNVSVKLFSFINGGCIVIVSVKLFSFFMQYWIMNLSVKLFSFINGGSIGDQERVCQTLQLLQWREYW